MESYLKGKTMYNKAEQFITKSLPIGKNWWANKFIFKVLDSKGNGTDGSGAVGFFSAHGDGQAAKLLSESVEKKKIPN